MASSFINKAMTPTLQELLENLHNELENQVGSTNRICCDFDDNKISCTVQRKIGRTTYNILYTFGGGNDEN